MNVATQRTVYKQTTRGASTQIAKATRSARWPWETTHLEVITTLQDGKRRSLEEQLLDLLAKGVVLTRVKLRDSLAVQNERLGAALESLERAGRLCRTPAGWQRLD